MNESDYIYSVLIRLAFATGMRQGELIALKWSDIKDGVIHVQRSTRFVTHIDKDMKRQRTREIWEPKTANAVRDIPLLPETQEMLAKHKSLQRQYFSRLHLGKQEYVFTNTAGGLVDPSILIQSYRCMLRNAGVPPRKFHAIRHTFATEAIRHGVDVKDLQLLMGHGDIQTTYLYVQASPKSKRNAIELMGVMM
jgi:integrase